MRAVEPELFELDGHGGLVLLGGHSPTSGRSHFPRLDTCPFTGATDIEPVRLPASGTLWGWTTVTAPPPGYDGPVPYGFGVVELDGGLRVVGRITETDSAALSFGQRMWVVADQVATGDDGTPVVSWAFSPTQPADGGAT